jgi:heptosyltransferase III
LKRILVIRGGAIGDFVLTLPALKALRDANPESHIEILGYKHIIALAEKRFYADATRSIEYSALSGFFAKGADLFQELKDYFSSFDLVISYLYDPDEIFAANLGNCGVEQLIHGPAKIEDREHATKQLIRPIRDLGIEVVDLAAKIFPSDEDRQFAQSFPVNRQQPIVTIHPGSGSEKKNWLLENWIKLGNDLLDRFSLIVVSGEADEMQIAKLKEEWTDRSVRFAENLPLPQLAAVLEQTVFIGHDSGISHLAAATGANCILLFGPTDPEIWAPLNENVRVVQAPSKQLDDLDLATVRAALDQALMRIGIST